MGDDWDDLLDSGSEEDPKQSKATKAAPKQPEADNWDLSDDSDEEPPKNQESAPTKPATTTTTDNNWDQSDESDVEQSKSPNAENAKNVDNAQNEQDDAEKLKKMQKKMQNYKKKAKKKNKRKKKKKAKPPITQQIPKGQDELIEMNSSDDSSEDNDKKNGKKKKMETYEERMRTDNDILFKGHKNPKEQQKKEDDRVMLSGQVTIKNFPLGSGRDCENLAEQISVLLNQKLFEDQITANDIFLFFNKLFASKIVEKLDMVDTKALNTKINAVLAAKQKAWHTKKNPKGKKKKKPQWIVADKFAAKQSRKIGHVDGAYDQDEYSLFD